MIIKTRLPKRELKKKKLKANNLKLLKEQIWRMYQMPFRALVVGIRNFKKNRDWAAGVMARPKAAFAFKALIYITVLGWLIMALLMETSERDIIAEVIDVYGQWFNAEPSDLSK